MPDINSAIEDFLASLPDDDWNALCARVRPPEGPKGAHVPNVGQQPNQTPESDHLAALEREGRWGEAMQVKAAQLARQISEQNRAGR